MAQASILHRWADSLARGLQSTLRHHPLPDLEDAPALRRFASHLATHIYAQPNLCKILETDVGGIVVHRLITGCIHGRFDLLPGHLADPIRNAFERDGRLASLKSPYVSFSTPHWGFVLVLPQQSIRLTSHASHWLVNRVQYSTRSEHRLSEQEIGSGPKEIHLRNLTETYPDQTFQADLSLSTPFRVFDQANLREKAARPGGTTPLPPGEYLVVMQPEACSNARDDEECHAPYRVLSGVCLRPGLPSLEIIHEGVSSVLAPSLKAGIYAAGENGKSVILEAGSRLHYGPVFEFQVYVPKEQHEGRIQIEVSSRGKVFLVEDLSIEETGGEGYDYSNSLERILPEAIKPLDSGIHPIRLKLSTSTTATTYDFWYWKGLKLISRQLGFLCDTPPLNIRFDLSRGIKKSSEGCTIPPSYHAPLLKIATEAGELIVVPRPGVMASCVDPDDKTTSEIRAEETLTIGNKETRVIEFQSGGGESWSILCNGKRFSGLDPGRPRFLTRLASFLANYGSSGVVNAVNDSGESIRLFRFSSDLVAKQLRREADHGLGIERWTTTIPYEGLGQLGLRLLDYSQRPEPIASAVMLLFGDGGLPGTEPRKVDAIEGVSAEVRFLAEEGNNPPRIKLVIEVSPTLTEDKLLLIEILKAPAGVDDWQQVQCADGPNTSQLCILTTGSAHTKPDSSTWWHHLWRENEHRFSAEFIPLYAVMDEGEMESALSTICQLMAIKYPTDVYFNSAKYLVTLAEKLCARRAAAQRLDTGTWWREGISELERHASARISPVVKQFLFTSNPEALRRHWVAEVRTKERGGGLISSSMHLANEVRIVGGRVEFAKTVYHLKQHPKELFESFRNFAKVISGADPDFEGFNYEKFFKPIFKRVLDHDEAASTLDDAPVLSARHLLVAIKAVNRRARILARASDAGTDHPLQKSLKSLSSCHLKAEQIMPFLNGRIGYLPWAGDSNLERPDHFDAPSFPELPLLDSPQANQLSGMAWCFCVLARGTAHGRLEICDFSKHLAVFMGSPVPAHPLNLILTCAPELFAYYSALLDFALYRSFHE
jgi:hypothetical protein